LRVGCTLSLWAAVWSVWLWLASTTPRSISTLIDVVCARFCLSYYWSTFFTHDDENKETRLIRARRRECFNNQQTSLINGCYTHVLFAPATAYKLCILTRTCTRGKQCIRTQCLARMYVYVLRHQPCAISSGTFCTPLRHSMCASVLVDFSVRLYPS
jgi:hypothetical protein